MITASAPGKLILCGEHAVVYGHPAIAIPILAVGASAAALAAPAGAGLTIEALDLNQRWRLSDDAPLPLLLRHALRFLGAAEPDLRIQLTSTVPIAGGMGSGAAVATALVRVVARTLGHELPPAAVSALVYESERMFHGTPSGIDNTVVAYQQPIWYQRRPADEPIIEPLQVGAQLELVVGDTGVRSETRAAVGDLRQRWLADPEPYNDCFAAIGEIVGRARSALETGDAGVLGRMLDENQSLLAWLGLSSVELDRLISAARAAGALGAKLSGGGWGGAMLALAGDAPAARAIAAALQDAGATRVLLSPLIVPAPEHPSAQPDRASTNWKLQ